MLLREIDLEVVDGLGEGVQLVLERVEQVEGRVEFERTAAVAGFGDRRAQIGQRLGKLFGAVGQLHR